MKRGGDDGMVTELGADRKFQMFTVWIRYGSISRRKWPSQPISKFRLSALRIPPNPDDSLLTSSLHRFK